MSDPGKHSAAVSFDDEPLILVDAADNEIGFLSKSRAHEGHGVLHRAFSIFLFDSRGRLLLQQRGAGKPLWPLYWSNSCCSHPRKGESMEEATARRLAEELGIAARLRFVYKFIYQADYGDRGAEHELCWVYIGCSDQPVRAHPAELADWRYAGFDEIEAELAADPDRFTPWFKLEWRRLMEDHLEEIEALLPARRRA